MILIHPKPGVKRPWGGGTKKGRAFYRTPGSAGGLRRRFKAEIYWKRLKYSWLVEKF